MGFDVRKKNKVSVSTKEAALELFQKLHESGCDPIKELARLAMAEDTPLSTRVLILKELAQYTAPKRRAVDLNPGGDEGAITVKIVKFSRDTKARVIDMMDPEAVKREQEQNNAEEKEEIAAGE